MAGAASAHQAATASREQSSQRRAVRTRRTSADPQRAQQGATAAAAAAPAPLDSLSRLQQLADASPQVAQLRRLQALADGRCAPVAQLAGGPEEEELIQGKFASAELQPQLQQAPRADNTGLPDQLKSGIESLSGLSLDVERVHFNSSQPAQLNAQGSDIHLAQGQERHFLHETWHIAQQAQGRMQPKFQMLDGEAVKDDTQLDAIGAHSLGHAANPAAQLATVDSAAGPVQRTVWEWNGRNWMPVRTEGYPTDRPAIPGGTVGERISTGTEHAWGKAPLQEEKKEEVSRRIIPTSGGMAEEEATAFAQEFEWQVVSTIKVTCSDPSHTPKGKVYTNGKVFYGADNTGHAGYGFKVWERDKGNRWKYKGNLVWTGIEWKHVARGTK
jgi:hypothetical protein